MKIIVLSMDNEIGENRRKLLNYDYEWFKCVSGEEIMDKFNFRYNTSQKLKDATASCFNSHLKIMKKIVDEKINDVVICEDDSIKELDINNIDTSNINEICLFGGTLRHPKNWKYDKEWRKEHVNDIVDNFKEGVNKIDYEKYRWAQTYSIYYPNWEKTNELLNNILNSKKSYCHLDIFLSKNKLINYLYYPTPFICDDNGLSQIANSFGIIKDYKVLGKNNKNKIYIKV
jgi:GR25 family glycosyltransferase involved in LPS biosynthesis